jgi:cell division septum initiation protein DivIVA
MAVRGDSEALEDALAMVMEHLESHLEPLAAEMVAALESAAMLREAAQAEPFSTLKSGRTLIHPGFEAADRDARRAISLAKALDLPAASVGRDVNPFLRLDQAEGRPVNLASRRNKRTKGGAA